MRRLLMLCLGVFIGQWLAFSGVQSPAPTAALALAAGARNDWTTAVRHWSHAVSLQPDNAYFNYMRAAALGRLGYRHAATDALQLTLLMNPDEGLAQRIRADLVGLAKPPAPSGAASAVALEGARGVWVANVVINDRHHGRFLVDTGSSVIVLAPAFARTVGIRPRDGSSLELETVAGRTRGPWAMVRSLRVGQAELRDAEVIIHSPGVDLDGILGNSFLSRWEMALDGDRRLLWLRRTAGDEAISASP